METGWLLLSTKDAYKRENYKPWGINHQFYTKCENQRASMAVFKDTVIFL